ncbi:hypothetical protein [Azospirillum sp. HJ39]|uniref:hypothetical protein n=1 Tax=Azospirillum sp. HJ39 TaxID=3159496 RepID=UPI0035575C04
MVAIDRLDRLRGHAGESADLPTSSPSRNSHVILLGNPGRTPEVCKLVEVLFIEALRSTAGPAAVPGLLRGLDDERLAVALGHIHESPASPWMVAQMAKELLRRKEGGIADISECVGYSSANMFSVAFSRHIGIPPTVYAQQQKVESHSSGSQIG